MDPSARKKGHVPVLRRAALPDSNQKTSLSLCVGGKEVRRAQRTLNLRVASYGLMPTALCSKNRGLGLEQLVGQCGTLESQLATLIQDSVFNLFLFRATV